MHAISDSFEHLQDVPEVVVGKIHRVFLVFLDQGVDHVLQNGWFRHRIHVQSERLARGVGGL